MKSLHELQTELLGIRIAAANQTLWNMGVAISERIRLSLNDAIGTYKFRVTERYTSLALDDYGTVTVLPPTADKVLQVHALESSTFERYPIRNYRHVPTPQTNLLFIDDTTHIFTGVGMNTRGLDIEYEARLKSFPPEAALPSSIGATDNTFVQVTGVTPAAVYKSPGYFEISSISDTDVREVVRYELATTEGFVSLTRVVEGVQRAWETGSRISPVFEGAEDAIPTIMAAAEANMYHFWVSHRSQYDQYVAAAGLQELDTKDLLGLIRSEEDRADRRYSHVRRLPGTTYAKRPKRPW